MVSPRQVYVDIRLDFNITSISQGTNTPDDNCPQRGDGRLTLTRSFRAPFHVMKMVDGAVTDVDVGGTLHVRKSRFTMSEGHCNPVVQARCNYNLTSAVKPSSTTCVAEAPFGCGPTFSEAAPGMVSISDALGATDCLVYAT